MRSPVPSHQQHRHCRRVLPRHHQFYCLSPCQEPCAGEGTRPGSALWAGNEGAARLGKIWFSNPSQYLPGRGLAGTPGLSQENTPLPAPLNNCSAPAFQAAATLESKDTNYLRQFLPLPAKLQAMRCSDKEKVNPIMRDLLQKSSRSPSSSSRFNEKHTTYQP